MKNTLIKLVVAAAALFPVAVGAQTSSINAFSPYTMYGIGEVNTPGTLSQRSMGGVGVAQRNAATINLLNPASYSLAPQKSFLFALGLEGQNYYNSQTDAGMQKRSAYNTFNFHDISFRLPLAKKIGLGFSLTPYSSVGYRTRYNHPYSSDDPISGNLGYLQYNYEGEGDVTEVKLGVGWQIFKNFSLGLALQYYWGDINRSFVMSPVVIIPESGSSFKPTVGNDDYSISSIKGQIGMQWDAILNDKRALTLGATFDLGGDLKPEVTQRIYLGDLVSSNVRGDTTRIAMVLPRQLAVGAYYQTAKWSLGLDYVYQNWGGRNKTVEYTGVDSGGDNFEVAYANTHTVKFGVEYTPSRYDVRNFFKRWSYRGGLRYGNHNQSFDGHNLSQYAVTLGIGIPVKFLAVSGVDVGVEYGRRGYNLSKSLGLVRQQYFKFAIGFSLFAGAENGEYWFSRPKYD